MQQTKLAICGSLLVVFLICIDVVLYCGGCSTKSNPTKLNDTPKTPAEVVRRYCQLDFNCGWYDPQIDMQSLLEREPASAGDTVVVVSGFRVLSKEQTGDRATIRVEYEVLAEIGGGERFYKFAPSDNLHDESNPGHISHTIDLHLVRVQNTWKIGKPITEVAAPHVSVSCAKKIQRQMIQEATDPAWKRKLERVLGQLEALSK